MGRPVRDVATGLLWVPAFVGGMCPDHEDGDWWLVVAVRRTRERGTGRSDEYGIVDMGE